MDGWRGRESGSISRETGGEKVFKKTTERVRLGVRDSRIMEENMLRVGM